MPDILQCIRDRLLFPGMPRVLLPVRRERSDRRSLTATFALDASARLPVKSMIINIVFQPETGGLVGPNPSENRVLLFGKERQSHMTEEYAFGLNRKG